MLRCRVRKHERRAEVDRKLAIPIRNGQLVKRLRRIQRRHVDEDVEPAEREGHVFDERFTSQRIRYIGANDHRAPPARAAPSPSHRMPPSPP